MIYIEWDDAYRIGVAELDEHHMHLIELLNRAYTACMLNNPMEDLRAIIQDLTEYTSYHFSAEEQVMGEHRYAGLPEQKREHESFNGNLADYIHKIEENEVCSSIELVELTEFMTNWIKEHILNQDAKFGDFLKGRTEQERKGT